jgi:anthranilate synthase component 1
VWPSSNTTPAEYERMVSAAKEYIAAGDIFQVVLSQRFQAPFALPPFALYRALRRVNPSPYLYFLDFGNFAVAGSSPEILVKVAGGTVTIRPIAGTRPRGKTPEEDLALEQELRADPKERAEHLMLLDLGRNDVGRVAMLKQAGGANEPPPTARGPRVRVTDSFFVERYSHVMHLVSNVEGDAPEGLDPVDVVMAALPAGTLSGAPKVRAMEIIDELEVEKRGVGYAGGVGYFGCDGSVDTCIVLRTALFKDEVMYVQAGGGVVADSDPDAEYDETLHKARALRRAAEESWRFV